MLGIKYEVAKTNIKTYKILKENDRAASDVLVCLKY